MHRFKVGDVVMIVQPSGVIDVDDGKLGEVVRKVAYGKYPYAVEGDDILGWTVRAADELTYIGRL